MIQIHHTAKCLARQRHARKLRDAFLLIWPNVCKNCEGRGGATDYDSVDYGSSRTLMPTWNPCEDCIEVGWCPRCGAPFCTDDSHCKGCGWQGNTARGESMPSLVECYGECRPEKKG